jgi:Ca-activated chloride channel family protein
VGARRGSRPPHGAAGGHDTEAYARIYENPFVAPSVAPRSTFAVDVDHASYSNVRRFLSEGRLPPADAVRIEELVNYFTYEDPAPAGGAPLAITTEVGRAPWAPGHRLVRVALQARRVPAASLPPSNLVFLIDVSGSMRPANRLPLVQQAFRLLVNQLRPQDRVALVVYAGAAGLVLPSTPGSEKARILAALDGLEAGGSTAGGAGLQLAYDVAREHHRPGVNSRVVLATDGDFNVGVSSDAEMVRLVERRREEGTSLTVLGVGSGNLKDAKMEQLADRGNGNYAYLDNLLEAQKALVHEMGGTLVTVAKDVKLQVEFNPRLVAGYRLLGYENRALRDEDFNDDAKDAGEIGAGHAVTALYEVIPVGAPDAARVRGVDPLRYAAPAAGASADDDEGARSAGADELLHVRLRYKEPAGGASRLLARAVGAAPRARPSADFAFASAVAMYGLALRESEHRGAGTLAGAAAIARGSLGADAGGYRAEFVRLAETAARLRGEALTAER